MEYIIDDKGNKLKFVINKKTPCQKTRQGIFSNGCEQKDLPARCSNW